MISVAFLILATWPADSPVRSPWGECSTQLVAEAQQHADYQATTGRMGHDYFAARSQRLGGVYEVCAVTVARDRDEAYDHCLTSWWRSPPHRAIIAGTYSTYGIAFSRATDGRWYACLILKR